MKIKFTEAPKGRAYKAGDIVEFKGKIDEGYALKYISRGWAEPYDDSAEKAAAKMKAEEESRAKADAEQKAKDEADAKARIAAQSAKGS